MLRLALTSMFAAVLVIPGTAGALVHVCGVVGDALPGGCPCDAASDAKHHGRHGAHQAAQEEDRGLASWEKRGCCRIELQQADSFRAGTASSESNHEAPHLAPVAFLAKQHLALRATSQLAMRRERAPPCTRGTPLYQMNCSFLN